MRKSLPQRGHDSKKDRLHQGHRRCLVIAMICAVVLSTVYTVVLPTGALTGQAANAGVLGQTYCGNEDADHEHTAECYSDSNANTGNTNLKGTDTNGANTGSANIGSANTEIEDAGSGITEDTEESETGKTDEGVDDDTDTGNGGSDDDKDHDGDQPKGSEDKTDDTESEKTDGVTAKESSEEQSNVTSENSTEEAKITTGAASAERSAKLQTAEISDDSTTLSEDNNAIVIEKDGLKMTISTQPGKNREPAQAEDGTYQYYTGEAATTTIDVSNPDSTDVDEGTVVRVYFQFDSESGKLNYATGTYTAVSTAGKSYAMTVVQTNTANCYYVELQRPEQGDTYSINLESSYPSPTSGGGNAQIWGGILKSDEKEQAGEGTISMENHQSLNWSTKADSFPITKTQKDANKTTLVGDGNGGAYISGLSYTIQMARDEETLQGIGKDYMRSVEFEDVLTLPGDVTLAEDVQQAIRNKTAEVSYTAGTGYRFKTADGREFLTVTSTYVAGNDYLQDGSVSLDESGNLVVKWKFLNKFLNNNQKTEISDLSFTYKVSDKTLLVKEPKAGETYTLENAAAATQHFMYSADQKKEDKCSATVKEAGSSLKISKESTQSASYYGEPRSYCITAENPDALPYENFAYLTDDLPTELYMRPADIAKSFWEDNDHRLTITITNAALCDARGGDTVSDIGGSKTAVTNPQNSGSKTTYSGMAKSDSDNTGAAATVTISWGTDGNLQISTGSKTVTCAAKETEIQTALQQLGFVVNAKTQYCLKWDRTDTDGKATPLPGGEKIEKNVYCANKDTFMLLDNDARIQHPTEAKTFQNVAYGYDQKMNPETRVEGATLRGETVSREFSLGKKWSLNGESFDRTTAIQEGDVLDYSLEVTHKGSGQYDALPLVDHMSGAQALLVPVEKNSGADWANGLKTVTKDGTDYYVLSTPGTYNNVWTSADQLADSVVVTKTESETETGSGTIDQQILYTCLCQIKFAWFLHGVVSGITIRTPTSSHSVYRFQSV